MGTSAALNERQMALIEYVRRNGRAETVFMTRSQIAIAQGLHRRGYLVTLASRYGRTCYAFNRWDAN